MSILIGIQSCWAHRDRHQAMRDTWLKDLPPEVQYYFFLGERPDGNDESTKEDERVLHCPDSYYALSLKTRKMCEWGYKNEYDFMFKCDTDTYVNVKNLLKEVESFDKFRRVYVGGQNEDVPPLCLLQAYNLNDGITYPTHIEFCSGGAGYWLDRACLRLVSEYAIIATCAEDVYVAKVLRDAAIRPIFRPGYLWRPGASLQPDTVTLHLSSAFQEKYVPEMMYAQKEVLDALQS